MPKLLHVSARRINTGLWMPQLALVLALVALPTLLHLLDLLPKLLACVRLTTMEMPELEHAPGVLTAAKLLLRQPLPPRLPEPIVHALLANMALIPVLAVLTVLRIPPQKLDPLPKLLASAMRTITAMPDPVLLDAPYVLTVELLRLKKHQVPPPMLFVHAPPISMEPILSLLLRAPPALVILPHLLTC
jgi:hypothetical protein